MKEIHPIAQCYPPLPLAEYEALVADIKKNGLIVPIVLYEDKILDGVHRAKACDEIGLTPQYISPEIKDPYAYVVSLNERRRNLTTGQRAVVAERMATLKRGTYPRIRGYVIPAIVVKEAAALNKVGTTSVDEARYAKENGIPEIYQALSDGKLKPYRAKDIARLPKDQQTQALQAELNGNKSAGNRKRQRLIPSNKSRETNTQLMLRRSEMLNKPVRDGQRPLSLTRKQVDPDFKGSSMEWMDKYGHVQVMTKDELEADQKQAVLMAWVNALNDLRGPLERYLECASLDFATFENWISGSPERRCKKVNDIVSLLDKAKQNLVMLPLKLKSHCPAPAEAQTRLSHFPAQAS